MGTCTSVRQGEVGIKETFGKFNEALDPGLHCICFCFGDSIRETVSLRIRQLPLRVETKTADDVFVEVKVAVQYQVLRKDVYDAYYQLSDPEQQIRAYVEDIVRQCVPEIKLDDVFKAKEEIAETVKERLQTDLAKFGYTIVNTLVTDVDPDPKVKASMNEINAAQRTREAATDQAEAKKIKVIKAAEADAQSKYLAGVGVARQRKAIVDGLRESVVQFSDIVDGTSPKDVMDLVLVTQYYDTLSDLGKQSNMNTIFVPHSGGGGNGISEQVRDGFLSGSIANESMKGGFGGKKRI